MRATLYDIDGPWPGRLAILSRPRGDDWLEDEIRAWRLAGIDTVVSTLTGGEMAELRLEDEANLCRANDIEFLSFPVPDRGVPFSLRETVELVRRLDDLLARGKGVGIHCRLGVGRSALLAGCLLIAAGLPAETAWERVAAARGCAVPETAEQQEWVARFAQHYPAVVSQG